MASFHYTIKSGKKGTARRHGAYIDREGALSARDDLVHSSHGNLPAWAENEPRTFWAMADRHERSNGAAYREHEIALPKELSVEQQIELADRLACALAGRKPYQYAIHAPEGALEGAGNPHVHLMCSDRVPDGVEREPERTFARFNPTQPDKGGCRKDSGGKSPLELRQQVTATRKLVADTQNQMLAECGHTTRVDHRSHRDRGLARRPERHLGPTLIKQMADAEKEQYVDYRAAHDDNT
ncbi:MobA/MobL family protein [Stenotrophomonas sp. Sa5BUN4]|uniref:MobA/MobL family protein n=1 Tax=Stenotrophomonas lacuserhaii TaxID=2760084 RepID=A0A8X8FSZ7_9GAMM|nr:MobA/MobL family protein [Stenotrophomonas pennii]MBD7954300.1 MobA/MobL family protein [Stenotrophomonas pennii]